MLRDRTALREYELVDTSTHPARVIRIAKLTELEAGMKTRAYAMNGSTFRYRLREK